MSSKHVWYACGEHVDNVLEDVIDEYELAPTMEIEPSSEHPCAWCEEIGNYRLELEFIDERPTE